MRNKVVFLSAICVAFVFASNSLSKEWSTFDACDNETEQPCERELRKLCGNPPENNQECIARNAKRLMAKTVRYRTCQHDIYVQCSKGRKCSSKNIEELCKW